MRAKLTLVGLSVGLLGAAIAGGVALASDGEEPQGGAPTEIVEDADSGEAESIANPDAPEAGEDDAPRVRIECVVDEHGASCDGGAGRDGDLGELPDKP